MQLPEVADAEQNLHAAFLVSGLVCLGGAPSAYKNIVLAPKMARKGRYMLCTKHPKNTFAAHFRNDFNRKTTKKG
jgi:hypothetical protein